MVSSHANNNSTTDAYANVMQGKVMFHGNQLPKIVWNQIQILIVANKNGKHKINRPPLPSLINFFLL
jgi:hypothetical protein